MNSLARAAAVLAAGGVIAVVLARLDRVERIQQAHRECVHWLADAVTAEVSTAR